MSFVPFFNMQITSKMLKHPAYLFSGPGANARFSVNPKFNKVMTEECRHSIIQSTQRRHTFSDPINEHKPSNSRESFELNDEDFMCTICTQLLNNPHIGPCGHSYCLKCIKDYDKCPTCGEDMDRLVPNKTFKEITEKFLLQKDKTEPKAVTVEDILERFRSGEVEPNQMFLDQLASMIAKQNKDEMMCSIQSEHLFLSRLLEEKVNDIELLKMQTEIIRKDVADIKLKMEGVDPIVNFQMSSFMQSNFDQIRESYIEIRMPDSVTSMSSLNKVEKWRNSFTDLTKYTSFHKLISSYINDIVSSIDFDKNEELFATGGIAKQLKVYNYQSIFDNREGLECSVQDISCKGKIKSLSFNHFLQGNLGSCGHDGGVILSDIYVGSHVRVWKEHQDRCWAVHWNQHDPKIIASASDDSTVKIWVSDMEYSAGSINTGGNVFSVRFHPTARNFVVYSCADGNVYYHDLCNICTPLYVLTGHKKAVTNSQFANDQELVSLSIDSDMKVWNVSTGECLKTYSGHRNHSTFVGLAVVNSNHIICGSEDNSLYLYSKHVSRPIISYDMNLLSDNPSSSNYFVTSVCWKPHSSNVISTNSHGYIAILELN